MQEFARWAAGPQADAFDLDVTKLNWSDYSKNSAFGVKNFFLQEESALPSKGYDDVVMRMV